MFATFSILATLILSQSFSRSTRYHDYYLCSRNQNIYTVDPSHPRVECILVEGSFIRDVGSLDEIEDRRTSSLLFYLPALVRKLTRPKVLRIDPNSIVIPGLADAHAHVLQYGYMMQLPLAGATSVEDVVERIKAYILAHPDVHDDKTRMIEGVGWDQTKWNGSHFPTASDLDNDPLLKGRPIVLTRVDFHAKWVSPRILELIGYFPDAIDGGEIVRDHNGDPTGIFVDLATQLVPTPSWSEDLMSEYMDLAMRDALSHGLTSIHDAMASPETISFFKRQAFHESRGRQITCKPYNNTSPSDIDRDFYQNRLYLMATVSSLNESVPYLHNHGVYNHLNVKSVKLFADGALGSWGAALLEPYSDKPDVSGQLVKQPEELANFVREFWERGFQVNVHCIGDRANHVVLDIFENLIEREKINVSEWRPRIEHAQIFTPSDIERIGRIGVIPSVQPTHATSDMGYAESRLGPARIKSAYAYRTLRSVTPNNVLPIGSDFPVESINPLMGFYAAVTRLHPDGHSPHGPGGWYPEEKLTRAQALKGMTLDAAYASFAEKEIGSLTPGKRADYVVLDRDIMSVPVSEILGTRVKATVVDGVVVYGKL